MHDRSVHDSDAPGFLGVQGGAAMSRPVAAKAPGSPASARRHEGAPAGAAARAVCIGIGCALLGVLPALATTPARPANGGAQGNRIEVTGNSARGVEVRCAPDGTRPSVSVNSVNVDGKALQGETVIVTGRNTQDVRVRDCPSPATGEKNGVNVNSVNIR